MTEEEKAKFASDCDKIYFAIRQVEDYTDYADELVDLVCEMADAYEDSKK